MSDDQDLPIDQQGHQQDQQGHQQGHQHGQGTHIPTCPPDDVDLESFLSAMIRGGKIQVDSRKGSIWSLAARRRNPDKKGVGLPQKASLRFTSQDLYDSARQPPEASGDSAVPGPGPGPARPQGSPTATAGSGAPVLARERGVMIHDPSQGLPPEASGDPTVDYVIHGKVGEGGMGLVFEADQLCLSRRVAIKTLRLELTENENAVDAFLREGLLTGQLDHPNVIPLYELGLDASGITFMVMKFIKGRTWHDLLHPDPLDTDLVQLSTWMDLLDHVEALSSVCNAVAFAHSRDIVHRDLKPGNVMLGKFGEVYVMDWGLATSVAPPEDALADLDLEPGGFEVVGSPNYMAPEMAMGKLDAIEKRSDVYLLGAILYELIYGRPPHAGSETVDVLIAARMNEISAPDQRPNGEPVPKNLLKTCLKALSTDPRERHHDVVAFQHDLRSFLLSP